IGTLRYPSARRNGRPRGLGCGGQVSVVFLETLPREVNMRLKLEVTRHVLFVDWSKRGKLLSVPLYPSRLSLPLSPLSHPRLHHHQASSITGQWKRGVILQHSFNQGGRRTSKPHKGGKISTLVDLALQCTHWFQALPPHTVVMALHPNHCTMTPQAQKMTSTDVASFAPLPRHEYLLSVVVLNPPTVRAPD
ncbi:hypothetical protein EDB86DRAFT_2981591, partial [Lactarius hatsudake]